MKVVSRMVGIETQMNLAVTERSNIVGLLFSKRPKPVISRGHVEANRNAPSKAKIPLYSQPKKTF